MKRWPLLAVLLLAGCGGTKTPIVTVTQAAAPARSCSTISGSAILLCERPPAREYTTAFYVRRGGRVVALAVAHPPRAKVGHWVTAYLSPDHKTLLAQWSAECEVPIAFFVAARGGVPRSLSRGDQQSLAHGWTGDGRAIVEFTHGECGGTVEQPGIYLVRPDGRRELVARVTSPAPAG